MKFRAFAVIAALAIPALASAGPGDAPKNPPAATPDSPNGGMTGDMNGAKKSDANDPKKTGGDAGKSGDRAGEKTGKLNDADTKTIAHLHHVNQMEIGLAKDALKLGTAHVKDYANTIITDHTTADKDLTAFAKSHKLAAIPADKATTDAERSDEKDMTTAMAHLKTLKGADFDKEYLNMMVSGHDKELTKIDVSISSAGDPDLKSMLQGVKPVLQRHADQARDLQKSPQASAMQPPDKLPSSR